MANHARCQNHERAHFRSRSLVYRYTVVTQSIPAQLLITETPWHNNSYYVPCPAQQHNSPMTKEIFVSFPED